MALKEVLEEGLSRERVTPEGNLEHQKWRKSNGNGKYLCTRNGIFPLIKIMFDGRKVKHIILSDAVLMYIDLIYIKKVEHKGEG